MVIVGFEKEDVTGNTGVRSGHWVQLLDSVVLRIQVEHRFEGVTLYVPGNSRPCKHRKVVVEEVER